ncbi:hypothetical protein ACH4FX_12220 [Streptomyces sp. NPDC018019]
MDDLRCQSRARAWGLNDQAARFSDAADDKVRELNDRVRAEEEERET